MQFNIRNLYEKATKKKIIKLLPEDGVPNHAEFLTSHLEKEFQKTIYYEFMFFDFPEKIYKDVLVFYYSLPQTDKEFLIEYKNILNKLDYDIQYNRYGIDIKKWGIGFNDDLNEIRLILKKQKEEIEERLNNAI